MSRIIDSSGSYVGMRFRSFDDFDAMVFRFSGPIRKSLDTMFCPPMDIAFVLGQDIVDIRRSVRPWRLVRPKKAYDMIVESKPGEINNTCRRMDLRIAIVD